MSAAGGPGLTPALMRSLTGKSAPTSSKSFSNSSSYAFINDREVVAQMTRRQKEQQKTFIRIIGFSSEGLLREAVSVLMELGAKPPPVSEHFQRILSPLSLASGGSGGGGSGSNGSTSMLNRDSFMYEANGNAERLKRSPFYSPPVNSSPHKSSTSDAFSVLTSGANSQVSTKERDAAINARSRPLRCSGSYSMLKAGKMSVILATNNNQSEKGKTIFITAPPS